jgi:hypothetical protein
VTVSRSQTWLAKNAIPMACPKNTMFKRGPTCLLLGVLTAHRVIVHQVQALNAKGIEAAFMASASGEQNNNHVVERLLGQ